LEVLSLAPTAFVFNAADWEVVELTGSDEASYALSSGASTLPVDRAARRLWGVPVVVSNAVPAGTGYCVDFAGSTELHLREDVRIDWSEATYDPNLFATDDGGTLFQANLLQFRCEMRAGFAVTRPAGVVELDLTA
jgi:capsid protein